MSEICIYVKSNALITSEDIYVIVENFWKNFGKCFLATLEFKFKEIRPIFPTNNNIAKIDIF
jgi:hypothetical protein